MPRGIDRFVPQPQLFELVGMFGHLREVHFAMKCWTVKLVFHGVHSTDTYFDGSHWTSAESTSFGERSENRSSLRLLAARGSAG